MEARLRPSQRLRPDVVPAAPGVGLKPEHYEQAIGQPGRVAWLEVHPENYFCAGGPPHHFLERVRRDHPLSLHGVGLSIGAPQPLDGAHLKRLRELADRYEPGLFSEHLAWSSHDAGFFNDLLPLPYTRETLDTVARHVDQVQEAMGRRMLIENPSTYVAFAHGEMEETEFIRALAQRTGCGLLLDVNNIVVSATNHGFDPLAYVKAFPLEHVGEIHLAGHDRQPEPDGGELLIDAHDRAVSDPVWNLYERVIALAGPRPTLIEWDNDVPGWEILVAEADKAAPILKRQARHAA